MDIINIKRDGLTPVIVQALQNDEQLRILYREMNKVLNSAIPKIIQISPTEFRSSYDDNTEKALQNIRQEIDFRYKQILSFYK